MVIKKRRTSSVNYEHDLRKQIRPVCRNLVLIAPQQDLLVGRRRCGVALTLHRVLNSLRVENFIKTSGQTGMRLMVPLAAKYDGGP